MDWDRRQDRNEFRGQARGTFALRKQVQLVNSCAPCYHNSATKDEVWGWVMDVLRLKGLDMGFVEVAAGPLVRSSYRADRILEKNNLGLPAATPIIPAVNLD